MNDRPIRLSGRGPLATQTEILRSRSARIVSSSQPRMREQISPLFYLCALGLIFAVLLGGGTRGGFLSDVILQFVSVPILLVALWRAGAGSLSRGQLCSLLFCAAILAVPLAQLAPLPPSIWTALPGRAILGPSYS